MSKVDPCVVFDGVQRWMNGLYSFSGLTTGKKEGKDLARTVDDGDYWYCWILGVSGNVNGANNVPQQYISKIHRSPSNPSDVLPKRILLQTIQQLSKTFYNLEHPYVACLC